jgi:hypothetical protein
MASVTSWAARRTLPRADGAFGGADGAFGGADGAFGGADGAFGGADGRLCPRSLAAGAFLVQRAILPIKVAWRSALPRHASASYRLVRMRTGQELQSELPGSLPSAIL